MKMSEFGLSLLREFEGLRLKPYKDAAGYSTIGYGHRLYSQPAPANFDRSLAESILEQDVERVSGLLRALLHPQELNDNQFSALVSFTFNVGYKAFCDSFMLRCIRANDFCGAAQEFPRWVLIDGKISEWQKSRRSKEQALFNLPIAENEKLDRTLTLHTS